MLIVIDRIMCGIVVFQLLTAGAHSGLVLQQALYGFQSAPIPELYWADQGQPTHLAQTALYLVNVRHKIALELSAFGLTMLNRISLRIAFWHVNIILMLIQNLLTVA